MLHNTLAKPWIMLAKEPMLLLITLVSVDGLGLREPVLSPLGYSVHVCHLRHPVRTL